MKEQILFQSGMNGYACYRIPVLCVCTNGDMIAFAEARKDDLCDYGRIDLVQRRSTDGGRTWSDIAVVCSDGVNTYGNPCPICCRDTGAVCLVYCYNDFNGGEEEILRGKAKRRVFERFSYDFGVSWSEPVDITGQVMLPHWTWYATGPCHGIQLKSGRLIVPCNHAEAGNEKIGQTKSHLIYSDDFGKQWSIGAESVFGTNEATVCQLSDDSLYLNMRSNRFGLKRAHAFSRDDGRTLEETGPSAHTDPYCQGSVYAAKDGTVFFTNCDAEKRQKLTLYSSHNGIEWTPKRVIHAGHSAYSDIGERNGELFVMYETGAQSPYEMIKICSI